MRATALMLVLATLAVPAAAQTRDVPWFQARPAVLEETLRRCHRDARLMETHECQNAEAASSSHLGQPRGAGGGFFGGKSSLPEPDYNPRNNPFGFQALKRACTEKPPGWDMFAPDCHQLDRYPVERDRGR